VVAESLTEALTEAARAAAEVRDWERDQEAWNLPQAQGETSARASTGEDDSGEADPAEQGDPPPISPETSD
jgi:hypothetical protein